MTAWIEIFKKFNDYVNNKNNINEKFSEYEHNDIKYINDEAGEFILEQTKLIEKVIDDIYSKLINEQIDWNNYVSITNDNNFSKFANDLLFFVKNFYNIIVD
ncbi:hypothetical protein NPA07_02935 [Mycoplasmopsis caviae]|uniref:Uncharacterized protein n=1 Tax=Mycoplasmopsis caviae TaxID=55603 RepID=A0A3P8KXW8_9BACT|nr:hypothetical protein [Mycoplasmopsis caviae]UUD34755.1 hypothetical protein NPA07_02935 [Mycoplasmopsis caviae]VDR41533.1 Uncharacterised protein [Mycoplasmopsis caviae]VDR42447.1 Uncharacterised protein [Mycoplasmopsis caviae]VDR42469.1 Uncharacterised protein [Mycoplasmopsis caviae]VDR42547.1 Uncharacterised protein [Mycoplasmopsis caviae]